jgi:tetratricopeptide (TPR) repeat protein
MSTTLRIEELKKKFDENPRRYFAPLANEYRKAGDLQQAISICQAHLPQQPGHMSGHIVYGQALFEAKQFEQARTVFETALALDPENLIALRYLGDIAFELGDRAGARSWYTRVLETDPRNEEIAALMAAMGEERGPAPREAAPSPAESGARAAATEPHRPSAATAGSGASGPTGATTPAKEPERPAARADDKVAEAAPSPSAADAELEKLFSSPPAAQPSAFSPLSGFGEARPSDAPPSLEQRAPSIDKGADSALRRPTFDAQRGDDAPLQNPPEAAQTPPLPSTVGSTGRDGGFVTETMAELYLKQGYHDRALDVYRHLVSQNPADRGLRERMERLEREMRAAATARGAGFGAGTMPRGGPQDRGGRDRPTVRQFLASLGTRGVTGRGPGVVPPPGGGPRTSGELRIPPERPERPARAAAGSIDALFAGAAASREDTAAASALADAFPAAGGAAQAGDSQIGGRPAHPAATELSLDHVFRDGGVEPPSGRGPGAVSYDQFFSQPGPSAGSGGQEPTAGAPPASGADDIEQFNAWLQGLKKR